MGVVCHIDFLFACYYATFHWGCLVLHHYCFHVLVYGFYVALLVLLLLLLLLCQTTVKQICIVEFSGGFCEDFLLFWHLYGISSYNCCHAISYFFHFSFLFSSFFEVHIHTSFFSFFIFFFSSYSYLILLSFFFSFFFFFWSSYSYFFLFSLPFSSFL